MPLQVYPDQQEQCKEQGTATWHTQTGYYQSIHSDGILLENMVILKMPL